MIITALLAFVLVCQVVLLSILCPRKIADAVQSKVVTQSKEAGSHQGIHRLYVLINYVIAILGFPVLLLCVVFHAEGTLSMTGLLLSIGMFFLVQVSTFTILFYHGVLPVQQTLDESSDTLASFVGKPSLFSILPIAPVIIAVGLYLSYVTTLYVFGDNSGGNQLHKVVSITITNFLFVSAIIWSYRSILKESDERVNRYNELARMGPIMIFGSIFVTLYLFAKEILFVFELHEFRPIMMSVALQMVAIVVFYVLSGVKINKTKA
ncbi:hypothetical protein H4J38_16320 [Colwellia sp. BRX10-3]|uniref:hypothetical protein n=1 Tax=Colwellia sp. BRX10-3 TaxID=2759844 RepID=UPI0015F7612B|nr:hypothetical protein [Colwellia sp. BRX10-3]MBA6392333.1 hypothetical protein [Colwellia sp. BRX10-3]